MFSKLRPLRSVQKDSEEEEVESQGIPEGWAGLGPLKINTPGGGRCPVSHAVVTHGGARRVGFQAAPPAGVGA